MGSLCRARTRSAASQCPSGGVKGWVRYFLTNENFSDGEFSAHKCKYHKKSLTSKNNKKMTSSRSTRWCFTINNYKEEDWERMLSFQHGTEVRYITVSKEIGQSGTRHLQGYIEFRKKKRLLGAKESISTTSDRDWETVM